MDGRKKKDKGERAKGWILMEKGKARAQCIACRYHTKHAPEPIRGDSSILFDPPLQADIKVHACKRRLKQDERNVTAHTHRHTNTHTHMTRCPLRLREEMLGAYTERLCLCWRIGNGRLRTIRNIPRSCCFLIENHHEKACLCRHDRDCFVVYVCWFPFER